LPVGIEEDRIVGSGEVMKSLMEKEKRFVKKGMVLLRA
jgi:hypothetical protein